jgi:hypothetical protein
MVLLFYDVIVVTVHSCDCDSFGYNCNAAGICDNSVDDIHKNLIAVVKMMDVTAVIAVIAMAAVIALVLQTQQLW